MNRDLTTGKPEKVLWQFAIPMFASVIFQQLYNIADSLIAGKFVGENALAAVGNSYEITLIYLAFAFGCNIGTSVIVARMFGAKQFKDMKTAVSTSFIASGVLCLILMVLGFALSPSLLRLINTPEDIFSGCELYLNIYTGGLLALFFYNIATGVFSAMGDSKTPLIFLAASSISNILIDILFVKAFNMGISGVAWATFLCQGVSSVLAVLTLMKRLKTVKTDENAPLFSWQILKSITFIAIPSILQQSFVSVGNIIIQGIINSFGASVIAGYSASIKLNNLVITSYTTLGNAMSNFTAQNIGAQKEERIRPGYIGGLKMIYLITIPFVLSYLLAGKWLISLFTKEISADVINAGYQFLLIVVPFYFVAATKLITDGILRGMGDMTKFMIATFTDLTLRVALTFVLSKEFGAVGIWMSWPVGWTVATVLSVGFFIAKMRGLKKNSQEDLQRVH